MPSAARSSIFHFAKFGALVHFGQFRGTFRLLDLSFDSFSHPGQLCHFRKVHFRDMLNPSQRNGIRVAKVRMVRRWNFLRL